MEPSLARRCWRTLEPTHGLVYFAPEATARYQALGLADRSGYFASRAAPMGAVTGAVVTATFFNFEPGLVERAMAGVWDRTDPPAVLDARAEAATEALRRAGSTALVPGASDGIDTDGLVRAVELLAQAAADLDVAGRPLAAAHAALPWPDEPLTALWHGISVLREHRGDGHVACLVEAGLDGCEALVAHAASGEVPRGVLQATRAWSDEAWAEAVARLEARGLVTAEGAATEAGAALRQRIEDRTDALAADPWDALGEERCAELRRLVRPLSRAVVASGALGG